MRKSLMFVYQDKISLAIGSMYYQLFETPEILIQKFEDYIRKMEKK